jgi:hypothetical protein
MTSPGTSRAWPWTLGGALLAMVVVAVPNLGGDESGDALVVLVPAAALVGALLGAGVARVVQRNRRS